MGLSGGADSSSLTAALAVAGVSRPLRAVHIDHGLQAAAPEFRATVESLCQRLAVPLTIVTVSVDERPGVSLEAAARDARYAALAAALGPGECLLTAHTRDDQAETFLLQALRGAGPMGLAAMPALRPLGKGWHLRPLLDVSREDLHAYAATVGISPASDPMNQDPRFDRVYLRQSLWPALQQRWPGASAALARAAQHSGEAQRQLERQADQDLALLRDGAALSVQSLRRLSGERQVNALRRWLDLAGAGLPSTVRLGEALRQMLEARPEQTPAVAWGGLALRRYRDRILLTPAAIPRLQGARRWDWRREPLLDLGPGLGRLHALQRPGGLRLPAAAHLDVRPRAGGERLRAAAGGRTQTVQHLCQARGIPSWMRDALPFIYCGDALIAVGDLWLGADLRGAPSEPGVAFAWDHSLALI